MRFSSNHFSWCIIRAMVLVLLAHFNCLICNLVDSCCYAKKYVRDKTVYLQVRYGDTFFVLFLQIEMPFNRQEISAIQFIIINGIKPCNDTYRVAREKLFGYADTKLTNQVLWELQLLVLWSYPSRWLPTFPFR